MRNISEFCKDYLDELKKSIDSLKISDLKEIVQILYQAYQQNKQIFIFGNGGSAATASHFVCDLAKGTIAKGKKRFKVMGLNDNIPLLTAWANDVSYEECFKEPLINFLQEGDIVIAFSASGNSKNVLEAVKYANYRKAITLGFTGFKGGELAKITHKSIIVKSGNMERIEDIHLILEHMIKTYLKEVIKNER